MNVIYDSKQLFDLLSYVYELTGIWANVHQLSGEDIRIRDAHCEFCTAINALPEGHERCVQCDAQAAKVCQDLKAPYHYRCHAGICETLIPIFDSGEVIAYLGFGQLLDESPLEKQWANTRQKLTWYPGDLQELEQKFLKIRQYSVKKTTALTETLRAVSTYVQIRKAVSSIGYTDLQSLEIYLTQHFTEQLTLKKISADLHMGTTKLCSLAKELSEGHTLTWLIASYRITAATRLLRTSETPISDIALMVGYEDYNYFTKVFRKMTGMTPRAYRSRMNHTEAGPA